MPETNVPKWLNLDEIVSPEMVDDLAKIRTEAEEFAPTVEAFARRAFRVTQAWEDTVGRANLPDEVWELTKDASGAEAVFEVIERMVNDLKVAWLEKPSIDKLPDWYAEEAAGLDYPEGEAR